MLFCLSCSACLVLSVLLCLSCSAYPTLPVGPVLPVLFLAVCPVLPVMFLGAFQKMGTMVGKTLLLWEGIRDTELKIERMGEKSHFTVGMKQRCRTGGKNGGTEGKSFLLCESSSKAKMTIGRVVGKISAVGEKQRFRTTDGKREGKVSLLLGRKQKFRTKDGHNK
jgi:hypothetical protein